MSRMHESITQTIINMSDGNLGALTILTELAAGQCPILPRKIAIITGLSVIVTLDNFEVYGDKVFLLFENCDKDLYKFKQFVGAIEYGILAPEQLKAFCKPIPLDRRFTVQQWHDLGLKLRESAEMHFESSINEGGSRHDDPIH